MKPVAPAAPLLADTCLAFRPVPQRRHRAVGMGRASAYRLRERPDAASFAATWDRAIATGRMHQFSIAMDRALNGVTIVRVLKGGAIDVSGGPDMAVVHAALRDEAVPPHRVKATKETE